MALENSQVMGPAPLYNHRGAEAVERLLGESNFHDWKFKMEMVLKANDLWTAHEPWSVWKQVKKT